MGETIARNKKARFDFEILDEYEAGIELLGSEVKSIRAKRVNLQDSYVRVIKNELHLVGAHIGVMETTYRAYAHEEIRVRKLLLHRKEIDKLIKKTLQEGMSIVTLSLYFNDRNKVKLKIALAKGKKLHDKRATMKENTLKREADRAIKGDY
ncbi:MAG: single-stranded DNA-binding protein [Sulfuricurvum sp. PC08-66]|nr:MAG: single-stranded DNA-binding protein [Sulfuricurvum sp. PC08-66]